MQSKGLSTFPTILDPTTCAKKGLCPINRGREQPRNLYYEIHGDLAASNRIVLIMGLLLTCSAWSEQVAHFGKKPDHAVLAIDNRGIGNSDCGPWGIYRTTEMAQDIKDLLDHLGWTDRSLHLFGVSLGGMQLQNLCLLIPERIKSTSFVSTRCGSVFDLPSMRAIATLLDIIRRKGPYERRVDQLFELLYPDNYLNELVSPGKTRRDELRNYFRTWFDNPQFPLAGIIGQFCAVTFHHCSDSDLRRIAEEVYPAKIAVICGNRDQLIPPMRSSELSSKMYGSELVLMQNAGHLIGTQITDQFNQLMERIIREGNQAFETKKQ
ncbi:hypothetical protein PCANC_07799 [Puccinia coronata f. sp. avenae]|uniref:AB hydrolase-1 domain-containing protein n=1 Tax=Puccinia coronata f. sp. avenae TaxID=200324 RepID=A0A2N5VBZ8_9BASI|nr:hypothetical protein PCANC_07799 [Puccinia coronata f. sp. avenae]